MENVVTTYGILLHPRPRRGTMSRISVLADGENIGVTISKDTISIILKSGEGI